MKMLNNIRALALAVYTAGIGHAANETDPLDVTLLPTLLGLDTDHVTADVYTLVTSGVWRQVDDQHVDTGISSQLQARDD